MLYKLSTAFVVALAQVCRNTKTSKYAHTVYTQKLQKFTICVHAQIPNRDAELFCVRLQKLQEKKICAYTQNLQTSSTCVDAQIPNADAELFCERLHKLQNMKICACTQKLLKSFTICVDTQILNIDAEQFAYVCINSKIRNSAHIRRKFKPSPSA